MAGRKIRLAVGAKGLVENVKETELTAMSTRKLGNTEKPPLAMAGLVYLMRGLPSCGKSTTARELVQSGGIVLETDQFFNQMVGRDPTQYHYDPARLDEARRWNLGRFKKSLVDRIDPIVVDRGNGRNKETRRYLELARDHGYQVELKEPDSPWWRELRILLKYREFVDPVLFDRYAHWLAEKSQATHRVPAETIRQWMAGWKSELTVDEIWNC